jgi:hypothetical protein
MTTQIRTGRTMRARQVGQAAALFTAPWFFVAANAADAWTTRRGGSDETAKGAIELAVAHPTLSKWASLAAMLGCLLLIPAALGAMSLARERAARLSLIGGTLVVTGYVCYFGLVFQGFATIALGQHGGATPDNIAIQQLITNQAFFVGPALTFVLGNIVGTFLLGLSLIRARAIPRWAGLAIMAWPILHILGGSWGEVVGAAAEAVGLAVVAVRLLEASPPDRVDDAREIANPAAAPATVR